MKTITFNGKTTKLYAAQIDAMETVAYQKFAAKLSDFERGRGRYKRTCMPGYSGWPNENRNSLRELLGLKEISKHQARTVREKAFFKANPRCHYGVFGNPRRINAMLAKVEAA